MLCLSNGHIVIDHKLAATFFEGAAQVNMVYYPKEMYLMLAPVMDELFSSLHKTKTVMLKSKNLKGDRSVSIQELLLDEDISPVNRPLAYTADSAMNVLTIRFNDSSL